MKRTIISTIAVAGMALSLAACTSTETTRMSTSGASSMGTTASGAPMGNSRMTERGNPNTGALGMGGAPTTTTTTEPPSGR